MSFVNPDLARFAASLNAAIDKVCDEMPDDFFSLFAPVSIELHTGDGLTARFYEEGIEFYPEEASSD